MPTKQSAGLVLFKKIEDVLHIFLVHPGGPYWQKKDNGSWSIPKGEFLTSEFGLEAAKREFFEETGTMLSGNFIELAPIKQKAGKTVYAWAIEGDINAENITSNTFQIQWPPKSNIMATFPEIDRAGWFTIDVARIKINPGQALFIDELLQKLETKV